MIKNGRGDVHGERHMVVCAQEVQGGKKLSEEGDVHLYKMLWGKDDREGHVVGH